MKTSEPGFCFVHSRADTKRSLALFQDQISSALLKPSADAATSSAGHVSEKAALNSDRFAFAAMSPKCIPISILHQPNLRLSV